MDDALCNQMEKKSAGLKVSMSNVGTYGASFAHHRGRQRAKWQPPAYAADGGGIWRGISGQTDIL